MNSEKIVENHSLPIRRVSRPSTLYFQQAERWWHIAVLSLPVDALLLVLIPFDTIPTNVTGLTNLTISCGILALLGLFRNSMLRGLENLWGKRVRFTQFRHRHGKTLIIGFTIIAAIEAVLHFGQFGWLVIAAVGIVSYRAFRELSKILQESRFREEQINRDRLILLEQRNLQVFCLVMAPILATRLFAFVGAVAASQRALPEDRLFDYGAVFALSVVGLLALRPEMGNFVTRCPRCSRPGSRVLASFGGCPACTRESFQIQPDEPQPMSAERILESKPAEATDRPAESTPSSRPQLITRLTGVFGSPHRSVDKE